jgi:hypothetical protein
MKTYLLLCVCPLIMAAGWVIAQEQPPAAQAKYRLVVSFISFASGTDGAARKKIDEYIAQFEKEKRVTLAKEVVRWGKEGEVDYCFGLTELSQSDQANFVEKINSLRSKRVTTQENAPCSHKK